MCGVVAGATDEHKRRGFVGGPQLLEALGSLVVPTVETPLVGRRQQWLPRFVSDEMVRVLRVIGEPTVVNDTSSIFSSLFLTDTE